MSLFLKIFLWFWLATALIVGAVMLVNWSTRTEPLAEQWRSFVAESINLNSQTAVQIYENEGLDGLNEYFDRQRSHRRINALGFLDENRKLIAGELEAADIGALVDSAVKSGEPELLRLPDKTFGAKRVILENGESYIYVVEIRRFNPPSFFTGRLLLQILVVILMAGLVCYALARYLSSPISKLRDATQRFAAGDLQARISNGARKRGDELSNLTGDFNEMAERIESLIRSEKRLTQDISHELRSPLARINVALELARRKSNPDTMHIIERLETESGRLNELISQLLTLSKLETGSESFDKAELNLTNLVKQTALDADFEARASAKAVDFRDGEEEYRVFGNEHLLRSAVENVLRNAVNYTKNDSTVEVSVERQNGMASVIVRDYGSGVPDGDLEKMFGPFYRVQEARDRKSGGTGLGLAIAERAVNNHNGKIIASNMGDGLRVEIKIPTL